MKRINKTHLGYIKFIMLMLIILVIASITLSIGLVKMAEALMYMDLAIYNCSK